MVSLNEIKIHTVMDMSFNSISLDKSAMWFIRELNQRFLAFNVPAILKKLKLGEAYSSARGDDCSRAVGRLLKRGGGRFKCQFLKGFFLH